MINKIIAKIPTKELMKKLSANFSSRISFFKFCVRIEKNDKSDEMVNNKATIEVNSSIRLSFVASVMCSDVITNRQKPSRLADVLNICWEVLLAKIYLFKGVAVHMIIRYFRLNLKRHKVKVTTQHYESVTCIRKVFRYLL